MSFYSNYHLLSSYLTFETEEENFKDFQSEYSVFASVLEEMLWEDGKDVKDISFRYVDSFETGKCIEVHCVERTTNEYMKLYVDYEKFIGNLQYVED